MPADRIKKTKVLKKNIQCQIMDKKNAIKLKIFFYFQTRIALMEARERPCRSSSLQLPTLSTQVKALVNTLIIPTKWVYTVHQFQKY